MTLNYTVTGASAVGDASCTDAGVDYITPSGSVTLLPTVTQAEISVQICPDDVAEGSETLLIELTGVPGRKLTGGGCSMLAPRSRAGSEREHKHPHRGVVPVALTASEPDMDLLSQT